MAGKPSAATLAAVDLVLHGVPPYRAARECGISPSTVYRALARRLDATQAAKSPSRKPR